MYSKEINRLQKENAISVIKSLIYLGGFIIIFFISMPFVLKLVLSFFCGSLIYKNAKKMSKNYLMIKQMQLQENSYENRQKHRNYQEEFNKILEEMMNDARFKNIYEQYKQQYQNQTNYRHSSKLANAYQLFKLPPESTIEEIKLRYRELAMKWHPDKWTTDTITNQNVAKRNFQKLQAAYELIKKDKNI